MKKKLLSKRKKAGKIALTWSSDTDTLGIVVLLEKMVDTEMLGIGPSAKV